jgi:hypothetical protein
VSTGPTSPTTPTTAPTSGASTLSTGGQLLATLALTAFYYFA